MADYDCEQIIDFVSQLLSKGLVVKLVEQYGENSIQHTMFKKIKGKIYVKGRKCCLKGKTTYDGWEINPLEFQDWWVDIIVDGMLVQILINRYMSIPKSEEEVVWTANSGYVLKTKAFHIPPSTLNKFDDKITQALTLKDLAILSLRHEHGYDALQELFYCFDNAMINTARSPLVWWISC